MEGIPIKDTEIFGETKLSNLLEEIHSTATRKREDINEIVKQLVEMMKEPSDAVMLLPLIKDLYKVSVENDEQVVKIATIVQRLISADSYAKGNDAGNAFLSEEDKEQLLANAHTEFDSSIKTIEKTLSDIKDRRPTK